MSSLRILSDDRLHANTIFMAGRERKYTHEVLLHLREVERRMLYADRGYGSLFEYCTKELKYSEAAAGRRVRASRLLKDIPEISQKVASGELNISNLAQVQSFIRQKEKRSGEAVSVEQKRNLIQKIECRSQEEAARLLIETFPDVPNIKERQRVLPDRETSVTMILSETVRKKVNRIKELTSHANDNVSWAELFERLADDYLKRHDPELKAEKSPSTQRLAAAKNSNALNHRADCVNPRTPIRVSVKAMIYKRAQSQCEHVDAKTRRRCERRYHLQIDHKIPLARGGTSDAGNLQLLCRAHNLWKGCRVSAVE